MAKAHWFDTLNASLAQDSDRRGFLHAAGALIAGLALSGFGTLAEAKRKKRANEKETAAAKNGGKGNGGGKGGKGNRGGKNNKNNKNDKDKKKRKPDPSCQAECDQGFALHPEEIPACVQKCNDCRIRANFCIIEGDTNDPKKVATCCYEGDMCCQDTNACCPRESICCPGYPQTSPSACCGNDEECCPSDFFGCCSKSETCCPGEGCVTLSRNQRNCGACGERCASDEVCTDGACEPAPPGSCPGRTLCDGYCVDTQRDRGNCGQCRKICREGQSCTGGKCEPEGYECCPTDNGPVCTYTTGPNAVNPWHCGACGNPCTRNRECIEGMCRCRDGFKWCDGAQWCVNEEWECCGNSFCAVKCCEESYCINQGTCP